MFLIGHFIADRLGLFDVSGSSMIADIGIEDVEDFILATWAAYGFDHWAAGDFAYDVGGRPVILCFDELYTRDFRSGAACCD